MLYRRTLYRHTAHTVRYRMVHAVQAYTVHAYSTHRTLPYGACCTGVQRAHGTWFACMLYRRTLYRHTAHTVRYRMVHAHSMPCCTAQPPPLEVKERNGSATRCKTKRYQIQTEIRSALELSASKNGVVAIPLPLHTRRSQRPLPRAPHAVHALYVYGITGVLVKTQSGVRGMDVKYKPAVRAYTRMVIEHSNTWSAAFEADRAVCPDGYGTRALYRGYDKRLNELRARVAARFGVDQEGLECAYQAYAHGDW